MYQLKVVTIAPIALAGSTRWGQIKVTSPVVDIRKWGHCKRWRILLRWYKLFSKADWFLKERAPANNQSSKLIGSSTDMSLLADKRVNNTSRLIIRNATIDTAKNSTSSFVHRSVHINWHMVRLSGETVVLQRLKAHGIFSIQKYFVFCPNKRYFSPKHCVLIFI